MARTKYLKLGEKARGFHDPASGVLLSGKMVVEVNNRQAKASKVKRALLGGHLVIVDQEEYKAWRKFEASTRTDIQTSTLIDNKELESENQDLRNRVEELEHTVEELKGIVEELQLEEDPKKESDFDSMTEGDLIDFYSEHYEVNKKEMKAFEEKELEDKKSFLKDLEEDNE